MQHLEVSCAVRPIQWPLGAKWLSRLRKLLLAREKVKRSPPSPSFKSFRGQHVARAIYGLRKRGERTAVVSSADNLCQCAMWEAGSEPCHFRTPNVLDQSEQRHKFRYLASTAHCQATQTSIFSGTLGQLSSLGIFFIVLPKCRSTRQTPSHQQHQYLAHCTAVFQPSALKCLDVSRQPLKPLFSSYLFIKQRS